MNLKRFWRALVLGVASVGLLLGTLTATGAAQAATTAPAKTACYWAHSKGYWWESRPYWSESHGRWYYHPAGWHWYGGYWYWYCPPRR